MAEANSNQNFEAQVWAWLADVPDPEIPAVSVVDLGMVRKVTILDSGVEVCVSPTYSGCPATEVIEDSIRSRLHGEGITNATIKRVLSPPWTTDWITEAGRRKLLEYGIVPPAGRAGKRELLGKGAVHCPRCGTNQTTVVSEFGSTACKASYKCNECLEPFEYFKCI
jgi:ring-1,2-phenylacetyl-CoA epoxidase subunit PaaD